MKITIDGNRYPVETGETVIQVLRRNQIEIPTLCYHPALKPSGSCKLCAVEVVSKTQRRTNMLACILKVRAEMVVETRSALVDQARTQAFLKLLNMAPQSQYIRQLAWQHGIDVGPMPDGCIRCRLCIRVCQQAVGAGALKMEKQGGRSLVVPIEGRCIGCGTCANLCPTKVIRVTDQDQVRTIAIRDAIIGRHRLTRCEGCGRYFATHSFMEMIARRTEPHPHVKELHNYCATCAKLFSPRAQTVRDHSLKHRMPGH
jgi:bidirectional [NiFe] hydrogenase diaphorase subunit